MTTLVGVAQRGCSASFFTYIKRLDDINMQAYDVIRYAYRTITEFSFLLF